MNAKAWFYSQSFNGGTRMPVEGRRPRVKHEVFAAEDGSGDYIVEAIELPGEGEIFTAVFSGPDAQNRAEEYAAWQNQGVPAGVAGEEKHE